MSGVIKKVLAVTVAAILVMAPLSFSFAAEDDDPYETIERNDEIVSWIIYQVLQSYGINISYGDVQGYNEFVESWIYDEVTEYLASQPSIDNVPSIPFWTADWKYYLDQWGHFIGNNSLLEDIEDFTNWLVAAFNIQDNSSMIVGLGQFLHFGNGVRAYPIKQKSALIANYNILYRDNNDGALCYGSTNNVDYSSYSPYIVFYRDETDNYTHGLIFSASSVTLNYYYIQKVPGETGTTIRAQSSFNLGQHLSWIYHGDGTHTEADISPWYTEKSNNSQTAYPRWTIYNEVYTSQEVLDAFGYVPVIDSEDYTIVSGDIVTPSEDPSYAPGFSIQIVNGSPIYIEIEWPDTMSIDNLPAIISPGGTQDPGFAGAWAPVRYFVNTFSESMGIIKTIVYGLPEQVMVIFYFILSVTVVFGAIHLFKEH